MEPLDYVPPLNPFKILEHARPFVFDGDGERKARRWARREIIGAFTLFGMLLPETLSTFFGIIADEPYVVIGTSAGALTTCAAMVTTYMLSVQNLRAAGPPDIEFYRGELEN